MLRLEDRFKPGFPHYVFPFTSRQIILLRIFYFWGGTYGLRPSWQRCQRVGRCAPKPTAGYADAGSGQSAPTEHTHLPASVLTSMRGPRVSRRSAVSTHLPDCRLAPVVGAGPVDTDARAAVGRAWASTARGPRRRETDADCRHRLRPSVPLRMSSVEKNVRTFVTESTIFCICSAWVTPSSFTEVFFRQWKLMHLWEMYKMYAFLISKCFPKVAHL